VNGIQYGRPKRKRRPPTLGETQQAWADYASPRPAGPPSTANPDWGVPIAGPELVVGDVIVHLGRRYPVDRIDPGRGGVRTAYSGVWGRTVAPDDVVRILPRATP
jgi:hypothetical protein